MVVPLLRYKARLVDLLESTPATPLMEVRSGGCFRNRSRMERIVTRGLRLWQQGSTDQPYVQQLRAGGLISSCRSFEVRKGRRTGSRSQGGAWRGPSADFLKGFCGEAPRALRGTAGLPSRSASPGHAFMSAP